MRGSGAVARWSLFALAWVGLSACAGEDLVLFVDIKTDFVPGGEFVLVRTEVTRDATSTGAIETSQSASRETSFGDDYLAGQRVAELMLPGAGSYLVRASLHDSTGAVVGRRSVRVEVRESYGLIMLLTRSCTGVVCPGGRDAADANTCLGGQCVREACSPLTPESCGTPECDGADDCTALVSCAEGRCADGYCLQVPIEGDCAADEWCSVERGCVELPGGTTDGGMGPCVPVSEACNGRDDDCDDAIDEAFDLSADVDHCGACDAACGGAHATASCAAGTCSLACDPGYADCDGDGANGCEADLAGAGSCGACGTSCGGETPLCVLSGASYSCAADCPATAPTLCGSSCVDTDTSLAHCGDCGVGCDPAAGTGTCAGGACRIASCDGGSGDCDGSTANGCETDLTTTADCGLCGRACGVATTCTGGSCTACGECEPGAMGSESCGWCGTRSRTCGATCGWGGWSSCGGEGVCNPGGMESRSCGDCGTQSRTCSSSCGWGSWGACGGEGVCSPGGPDTGACGNCGTRSRTCGGTCSWGSYGACTGEGVCSPGGTTGTGCFNSCQRQTCEATCAYDGECTACACGSSTQCGLSCPSAYHAASYSRSSSCGSGSSINQVRCEPDCGSSFTKCGLSCGAGYHPTSYTRSSSCGSGSSDNQTRCGLNYGSSFVSCGLSCPSGYHARSYSRSSSCGSGSSNNQVRCDID